MIADKESNEASSQTPLVNPIHNNYLLVLKDEQNNNIIKDIKEIEKELLLNKSSHNQIHINNTREEVKTIVDLIGSEDKWTLDFDSDLLVPEEEYQLKDINFNDPQVVEEV
jgi:hypothetical protein